MNEIITWIHENQIVAIMIALAAFMALLTVNTIILALLRMDCRHHSMERDQKTGELRKAE